MREFRKVTSFIESEIAAGSIPGAALAVNLRGSRIFECARGTYCNLTQRTNPMDADVTFPAFSFSKGISATVIVLAHQHGLIDYDAPVKTYIPAYRGGWKDETTIRHLLTHAAGIPNCPMTAVYTEDQWQSCISSCCEATVASQPGSSTPYHWASAILLAAEAVRQRMDMHTWEEICRELLLDPIGAEGLSLRIPATPSLAISPQPAELPYSIDPATAVGLGHPGAGFFGRLDDILKVLDLHLAGGVWEGRTIMNAPELAEMHRVQYETEIAAAEKAGTPPAHEPYGLGWLLKRTRTNHWFGLGTSTSPRTFGHAGVDTVMSVGDPQRQLSIAFMTTDAPKPSGENTTRIRNAVTDLVLEELS